MPLLCQMINASVLDVESRLESGSKFESDNSDSDQNHSSGYNSNGNPSHISNEDLEDQQNELNIEAINDPQVVLGLNALGG